MLAWVVPRAVARGPWEGQAQVQPLAQASVPGPTSAARGAAQGGLLGVVVPGVAPRLVAAAWAHQAEVWVAALQAPPTVPGVPPIQVGEQAGVGARMAVLALAAVAVLASEA